MYIIGITGPSGSGKGAASDYLALKYGFKVIDADKVYHSMISAPSDCVSELVANFGNPVLNENGGIDRKALSNLVFGEKNKNKLLLLNEITHKYVISEINNLINDYSDAGAEVCIIDAPLLIEAGVNKMCNYVIAIKADKHIRAERIAKRDRISKESALLRIESQKNDSFYEENCDLVLQNDFSLTELRILIDKYVDNLRHRSIIK